MAQRSRRRSSPTLWPLAGFRRRPEAEKRRTRPSGAGNQPGNLGEAPVALVAVFESLFKNRHNMGVATPATYEPGAGLDLGGVEEAHLRARFNVPGEFQEAPARGGTETPVGLFLDVVTQCPDQKILVDVAWVGAAKGLAPEHPKFWSAHPGQAL